MGPNISGAPIAGANILLAPQFNDSGSLYFMPNPGFVDIIDVQHGLLRMRFSLSEAVANVVSPMAIDSGGQYLFLITNQGLTIVNLGRLSSRSAMSVPIRPQAGRRLRFAEVALPRG